MQRESSQTINDAAAAWAARIDRAQLTAEDAARLDSWLAGDARRRGALLRAKAVLMHSEAAAGLGPEYDPEAFRTNAPRNRMSLRIRRSEGIPSGRKAFAWAAALAATLALAAILPLPGSGAVAYATERGEMRLVPLGKGATVTLNTATRVLVHEDSGRRRVTLLEGEAWFEVAHNATNPFSVEVDGRQLSTTGGAFVVRKLAQSPVTIVVRDGRVDLPGSSDAVHANRRALLPAPSAPAVIGQVSSDEIVRNLSWREGKIAFRGESLAEASAEFARYSGKPVVIVDPELSREQVTGLFSANDPVGFGHAVAGVFDAHVEESAGVVVVTRRH